MMMMMMMINISTCFIIRPCRPKCCSIIDYACFAGYPASVQWTSCLPTRLLDLFTLSHRIL